MRPKASQQNVEAQLTVIEGADRADLLTYWREHYDVPPPKNISTGLLRRAVAYKVQEKAYGGLKPAIRSYLRQVADSSRSSGSAVRVGVSGSGSPSTSPLPEPPASASDLPVGSRLVREWNGKTYEVVVSDDGGFVMDGARYRSLSEIARLITGTAWSGPRFFGLVKVKSK